MGYHKCSRTKIHCFKFWQYKCIMIFFPRGMLFQHLDHKTFTFACRPNLFPIVVKSWTIAISFIEPIRVSRVLWCVGFTKTVCFMAVTETAVNKFLDKETR